MNFYNYLLEVEIFVAKGVDIKTVNINLKESDKEKVELLVGYSEK